VLNKKLASLLAASAFVALTGTIPSAHAQMVPMPPPSRVDVYTNGPQADPGDNPANWSARQNVVDSERYERLVHTNPAFRQARIQKECGSINEPDLYQQCVASFGR
jgi:ABC-type transport system substrate-binding protein